MPRNFKPACACTCVYAPFIFVHTILQQLTKSCTTSTMSCTALVMTYGTSCSTSGLSYTTTNMSSLWSLHHKLHHDS